jgi:hypothetical protein
MLRRLDFLRAELRRYRQRLATTEVNLTKLDPPILNNQRETVIIKNS